MNECAQRPSSLCSPILSCNAVVGNDTIRLLNVVAETLNIQGNEFSRKWPNKLHQQVGHTLLLELMCHFYY